METMKLKARKLSPEFYCTKEGVCDKMYTCINPTELLNPACPHLVVKSFRWGEVNLSIDTSDKRTQEGN